MNGLGSLDKNQIEVKNHKLYLADANNNWTCVHSDHLFHLLLPNHPRHLPRQGLMERYLYKCGNTLKTWEIPNILEIVLGKTRVAKVVKGTNGLRQKFGLGRKFQAHIRYFVAILRIFVIYALFWRPCKFFLASVNFYRFNAKNWQFTV